MDAIARFADHVVRTTFDDLSPAAILAAKTYILDSFGVGIAGSAGPWVEELAACQNLWGTGEQARVWVLGDRLPAPAAAFCNAYQIHNSEFDCVHEAAVLHPMTVLLAAMMAFAEREGSVSGRDLILGSVLGVDIACNLGLGSTAPLRFFRPATAGGFAAAAGVGKLMGFDAERLVEAMSIVYGQMCGTMQAHTEGSTLLGMQVGFNARNAIVACDMAAHGLVGPRNVLEGPFGYFNLFEGGYDLDQVMRDLGSVWRITEVAHKPFPSGRATHGVVDGCMELKRSHGFDLAAIETVSAKVPPLVHHLVGRPIQAEMAPNYARLCVAYVAARALLHDFIGVDDFKPEAMRDPACQALGNRFEVTIDDNPDPNALTPVVVEITLADGTRHEIRQDVVYGNPARPMTREAHLAKFRRNWQAALRPLREADGERLIALVDDLETVDDVRPLVDLMAG